jgi:hypothetical protein
VEARGRRTGCTLWWREAPAGRGSLCGFRRKATPDLGGEGCESGRKIAVDMGEEAGVAMSRSRTGRKVAKGVPCLCSCAACASACGYRVEHYWAENEGFGPGGLGIELLGLVGKNGSLTLQNLCSSYRLVKVRMASPRSALYVPRRLEGSRAPRLALSPEKHSLCVSQVNLNREIIYMHIEL